VSDEAGHATAEDELVITRVFDAPRDLVWRVLSEADHLRHWWGPKGWVMQVMTLDFRPGGIFHYSMRTRGGDDLWGTLTYREIVPPERLVFITAFADEAGNTVRAPFNVHWPLEVLNTWTLAEQDGRTTLTLRGVPFNATEAEHQAFREGFASMRQGFAGTFDQLAHYLATV
jgi:uncharacterized protein YndB with AHSA1/START domain